MVSKFDSWSIVSCDCMFTFRNEIRRVTSKGMTDAMCCLKIPPPPPAIEYCNSHYDGRFYLRHF